MEYGKHLDYEQFENSACFRVTPEKDVEALLPAYDIEQKILRSNHELSDDDFDTALFVDESKAEFAINTDVADASELISDVRELIEKYNEPPSDLSEDEKSDYREMNVEISDISEF